MNSFEGKAILITGANGFIGRRLAAQISKIAGTKLLLFSRRTQRSTQQNIVWLNGKLEELTQAYWRSEGVGHIDYLFHLGAFTPKKYAEANCINQIVEDNILGTHALLKSLTGKITKLIFSSSADVYARPEDGEVLTENSLVKPGTVYGASKLFCEHLVSAWAKENGCEYGILRYGNIYGPGEDGYEKLIPLVIRKLLSNQSPAIDGDGSAVRDYLYVDDVIEATLRAGLVEGNIGPLNIVRGESISIKEVVQMLIRLTGSDKGMELLMNKPNGASIRFDNALMTRLLGNWPMTGMEEGLAAEISGVSG